MKVTKTDTGVRLDLTHAEARILRQADTMFSGLGEFSYPIDEEWMPQLLRAQDLLTDIDIALAAGGIHYNDCSTSAYDEDPS